MPQQFDGTRVQAPDTPDAAPLDVHNLSGMDFFAAAPRPVQDDRLGQLADSLGHFDQNVRQYSRYYEMNQRITMRGQQKTDMDGAQALIASKTPQEWQQAVKDGTLQRFQSPMAQLAVDRTTGQYTAHDLGVQLQGKLATGELNAADGSAQTWLNEQRQQIIQQNGWDQSSGQMRGFGDSYNSLWQNLSAKTVQAQAQATNAAQQDAAYKQFEMVADHAQQTGMSVQQSAAAFNNLKTSLMQTMHFEPKELDPIMMQVLGRRVAQDPNWVVGIATAPRPDATGGAASIPSLAENPAYATTVDRWKQQQVSFNADAAKTQIQQQVGSQDLQALLRGDGSFNSIEDGTVKNSVSGADIDLKAKARQQAAIDQFEQVSRHDAMANRETPLQTFNREAPVFINNDVKRDSWVRQIEGATALANNTNLTNPDDVKRLVSAGQTYAQLQAMSPAYVSEHFSTRARQFFDAYGVLRQYGADQDGTKWDDTRAMNAAAEAIRPDSPEKDSYAAAQVTEAKSQVGSLASPGSLYARTVGRFFGADVTTASNLGQLQSELMRLSTALARSGGLDGTTAVDKAAEMLGKTSSVRNGQWMPNENLLGSGVDDGAAFRSVSDRIAQQYADGPGKQVGLDAHQVVLKAEGSGYYRLTDTSGFPIPGGPRFSRADLIGQLRAMQTEQQGKILEEQKATAEGAVERKKAGYDGFDPFADSNVGQ